MGWVSNVADEACHAFVGVVDGEVVDEWSEEAGAGAASEHNFVGGWLGHDLTFTASGVRWPHSWWYLTRVRYATARGGNEFDSRRIG